MKTRMNDYILQHRSKDPNRYYVYLHRRLSDNSIFYVGKGCGGRAWSPHSRNSYWTNIKNKHGFSVEILFDNLDEDSSLQCEIDVIAELTYFGVKLSNMTSGGESPKFTDESIKKMSDSRKGVKKSEEHVLAVANALRGVPRPFTAGRNNPNSDTCKYEFLNIETLEIFYGTRYELSEKYNLNFKTLKGLFAKRARKSSQGWALYNSSITIDENIKSILQFKTVGTTIEYDFYNINTKDSFTGTRKELSDKYNISIDLIHALFSKTPRYQSHGWILK